MARGGDNTSAILILEQLVERVPDNTEARESLRQLYTAERMEDRAAEQCRELARLYKGAGDYSRAREMEDLADALVPSRGFGFDIESPLGKPAWYILFPSRVVGIPIVAGIAFEIIKLFGKYRSKRWAQIAMWPGMQLQKLTTRPPDLSQLAVAIAAMEAVLAVENPEDASEEDRVGMEVVA